MALAEPNAAQRSPDIAGSQHCYMMHVAYHNCDLGREELAEQSRYAGGSDVYRAGYCFENLFRGL